MKTIFERVCQKGTAELRRPSRAVFFQQNERQWIILVLVLGGRDYVNPKRRQYIPGFFSGIYCQLGDGIYRSHLLREKT